MPRAAEQAARLLEVEALVGGQHGEAPPALVVQQERLAVWRGSSPVAFASCSAL